MKNLLILSKHKPNDRKDYTYTFPIGICYISSVIKKAGFQLDCVNLNHYGNVEEVLKNILKENYDNILSGNIFNGYLAIKEMIPIIRKYSPNSKIIIGGSIITCDPLAMEDLKPDFGIVGEGEITIINLLKQLEKKESLKDVKGIYYFDEGLKYTGDEEYVQELSDLPYPDLESFGYREYLENSYSNQEIFSALDYPRMYPIVGSRGCVFSCTFCYHRGKYRERKIDDVIAEIKYAVDKFNINFVALFDDLFAIKKERLLEFCEKIKPLNLKYTCQISIQYLDEEILKNLKESGCFMISYGFESYSEKVLKSMKKPITPKQIDFAIKKTMEYGLNVQGNFIFGDPAETKETYKETLKYWKDNCDGQVNLAFVQPYPGAEVYDRCLRLGVIKDRLKYISMVCGLEAFINMTEMSEEEYVEMVREIKELRTKYSHYSKIKIKKTEKNYQITVECPFCKKEIKYENFNPHGNLTLICRECFKRFFGILTMSDLISAELKWD